MKWQSEGMKVECNLSSEVQFTMNHSQGMKQVAIKLDASTLEFAMDFDVGILKEGVGNLTFNFNLYLFVHNLCEYLIVVRILNYILVPFGHRSR